MKSKVETVSGGAREFDVRIYHGDISVRATQQDDWQLEYASDRDEAPILERDGDTVRIRQPGEPVNPPRLNLRLSIPAGSEVVRLHTGNGRISGDGVRGQLVIESGNGDLTLHATGGDVNLKTANGKVQVADVEGKLQISNGNGDILVQDAGGEAMLETNNGRIEVTVPRALALTIHSGHGDIQIGDGTLARLDASTNSGRVSCSADLAEGQHRLHSGHGDIKLRAARGEVAARTMSGQIAVGDARGQLHAHSGHGDLLLQAATGAVTLETQAGRIEVKVPRELHLTAMAGNGDIHVGAGSVQTGELETKRGTIHCSATLATGPHTFTSGHGDIKLRAIQGTSLLKTNAGRIEVEDAGGSTTARSGNGDVVVRGAEGELDLQTNNGRIEVGAPRAAHIRAHSSHGDVRIGDGAVLGLEGRTNMGRVTCTADLGAGSHELASGNGDIMLKLRPDAHARIDAQTSFGQVHADFALVRVGRSGSMSFNGTRMVGSIGPGEPESDIALRTGRGQVEIRRKEENGARYERVSAGVTAEERAQPDETPVEQRRLEVLQALARGEISLEQADTMLS